MHLLEHFLRPTQSKLTTHSLTVVTSLYGSKAFPFVPSDDGGDSDSDDGVTGGAGEKRACIWGQSVVDAEKESNAVDDETSSEESDFEGMDEVAIGDIMLDEDAKVSGPHIYLPCL